MGGAQEEDRGSREPGAGEGAQEAGKRSLGTYYSQQGHASLMKKEGGRSLVVKKRGSKRGSKIGSKRGSKRGSKVRIEERREVSPRSFGGGLRRRAHGEPLSLDPPLCYLPL